MLSIFSFSVAVHDVVRYSTPAYDSPLLEGPIKASTLNSHQAELSIRCIDDEIDSLI